VLRPATTPRDLEAIARAALENRAGRHLTDQEWNAAKHDLLAFFRLARDWNHEDATPTPVAPNATSPHTIPPNATTTEHPDRAVVSLAIEAGSGCS
jgi:hypothetical protein